MYPLPPNEVSRLQALHDLDVMGSGTVSQYDAICRTAQAPPTSSTPFVVWHASAGQRSNDPAAGSTRSVPVSRGGLMWASG